MGRVPPLEQAIERDEAAARGGVMGGAESQASVDLEGEAPRGYFAPVVTAMHQEAAGPHRPPQPLGLGHPIPQWNLLDPERANTHFAGNAFDQLDQPLAGRFLGVMHRHFDLAWAALEQGDGQGCRRTLGCFKDGGDCLGNVSRRLDDSDVGHCLHGAGA
jgi:hypothetical protein